MKAITTIACNNERGTRDDVDFASVEKDDPRSDTSQAIRSAHENGLMLGRWPRATTLSISLARSLERATETGQWKVAEAIIRQIERIELARAGNVVSIDSRRIPSPDKSPPTTPLSELDKAIAKASEEAERAILYGDRNFVGPLPPPR